MKLYTPYFNLSSKSSLVFKPISLFFFKSYKDVWPRNFGLNLVKGSTTASIQDEKGNYKMEYNFDIYYLEVHLWKLLIEVGIYGKKTKI